MNATVSNSLHCYTWHFKHATCEGNILYVSIKVPNILLYSTHWKQSTLTSSKPMFPWLKFEKWKVVVFKMSQGFFTFYFVLIAQHARYALNSPAQITNLCTNRMCCCGSVVFHFVLSKFVWVAQIVWTVRHTRWECIRTSTNLHKCSIKCLKTSSYCKN